MPDLPPTPGLLSDREADADLLDFSPYTETLLDIIRDPNTLGPLVIGLFGTWGSGKTSLMRFVERDLRQPLKNTGRAFKVAWFDAWKYEKEEALWRALLLRVIDELRDRDAVGTDVTPQPLKSDIEHLEQRLYVISKLADRRKIPMSASLPGNSRWARRTTKSKSCSRCPKPRTGQKSGRRRDGSTTRNHAIR